MSRIVYLNECFRLLWILICFHVGFLVFISGMRMAFNVCGEFAGFKFIFFKHKFELDFSAWFDVCN